MHPLKQYLADVEEPLKSFAARVCVSRQTLHRIMSGAQTPKPSLARRIVEATGGAVAFEMLYDQIDRSFQPGGECSEPEGLRLASVKKSVEAALQVAMTSAAPPPSSLIDTAAEATMETYGVLRKLTSAKKHAPLAQAFRPVLEVVIREIGLRSTTALLDAAANRAAAHYQQHEDHADSYVADGACCDYASRATGKSPSRSL